MSAVEPAQVAAVREASRQMVRELGFLNTLSASAGLGAPQCHALLELHRRGTLSVNELAAVLRVDKSNASRTAAQLLRAGWAERVGDPADRRRRRLCLSDAGRAKLAEVDSSADSQVSRALARMPESARGELATALAAYARALGRDRVLDQLQIRPIARTDDAGMARIIREVMIASGAGGEGFSITDPEVAAMSAAYGEPGKAYFVAESAGELLGGAGIGPLAGGEASVAELKKMYLVEAARGAGVGRMLLARCLDTARQMGYTRCYLETLSSMEAARRLYEAAGFVRLDAPMGCTGHHGCDRWYELAL